MRYPCIGMAGKEPEVLSNFDTNIIIGDIRISNSGEVWMTNEESHHITKYNQDGTIDRYLNTTAYNENFIIDKNGNLLACDYWDDRITKITPHGRVSPLIKNLPSAPTGICINHEGDIVVCMINHHWMAVYTSDGQIKKREMSIREPCYKKSSSKKGEENLEGGFECKLDYQAESPYRVVQNSRRDYVVVDGVWPYKIICLDVHGNFRWKYFIEQCIQEESFQYNIVCTKNDDIIIADIEYQSFHVINSDGQFIKYIPFKDHGIVDAWSMALDNEGNLYAGQDDGRVHIIDLNL